MWLQRGLLVPVMLACFTQERAAVSEGRMCSDICLCCHTETDVADQTFTSSSHSILTPGQPAQAPYSSGYPTTRLVIIGSALELAGPVSIYCGCVRKLVLQFLSQCGSTYNCLSRSVPDIHKYVTGTKTNQPTNQLIIIIIIIMMMMMMMMIAFKGAVRDPLQSPHCAANCLQHVRSSGPGATVCKSRATHRAPITCNMSC